MARRLTFSRSTAICAIVQPATLDKCACRELNYFIKEPSMTRSTSRNKRKSKIKQLKNRRRANKKSPLAFESLEARNLLATFIVNSTVDDASGAMDGLISLREATIAANTNAAFGDATAGDADGDVIRFDASIAGETYVLTEGEIGISDDVLIQGGQSGLTIDAQSNSRIFNVATTETVGIGRLNLTGGLADNGGAIYVNGGKTILNAVNFMANEATGAGGGAVYLESGSLYATDSMFVENLATGASGSGGALLQLDGNVGIFNGAMMANEANRAGGAIEIVDGTFYSGNLVVGGEGNGNIAGPEGTAAPGNGGGMHVTGNATIIVSGGSYVGNYAAREGGGLWNQAGSNMFVSGAAITGNIAAGDSADDGGGGIFNNGGDLFVSGTDISDNWATGASGSGGGIFSTDGVVHVASSTIDTNVANRAGGGVEIVNGSFRLRNSTLGGETTESGNVAGPAGMAAPGNGGGLHVTGEASILISNTMVANNTAASEGGGLWNQAGSFMQTDSGTVISANVAHGHAPDTGGGGIFNNGGGLSVIDTMIVGNVADGTSGSGGGIFSTAGNVFVANSQLESNIANRAGGGIELIDGRLDFNQSTLGGDTAQTGNVAGPEQSAAPGNGGGLHITGMEASAYFRSSMVANNIAASEGGGLWNQAGSLLRIDGTSIESNSANGNDADNGGGGIFNNGGRLTIANETSIISNSAAGTSGSGGGIFSTDGPVLIFDTTIDGNAAARAGGGVEIVNGLMRFVDSTISGNDVGVTFAAMPGNGGGLHVSGSEASVYLDSTTVSENVAASEGGGLWNQAGSLLRVDQGTVVSTNIAQGDDADNGGGGIFNNGGRLTIVDAMISGNLANGASGSGGGLLSTDGAVLVFNSTFDGNAAARAGGAIEVIDGFTRLSGTTVSNNDAGVTLPAAPGSGGGLHVSGNESTFVLVDSTFTGNIAQNQGGGLWNQTDSRLLLQGGNQIENNRSVTGVGGGIYTRGFLRSVDSVFETNASGANGGGIFVTSTGNARVIESEFLGNTALMGAGIFNDGTLNVTDSIFSDNIAGLDGGAIFTDAMATTLESGNMFSGNLPNDQN